MFDSNDKLVQKWAPVLEHADAPAITDAHKKAVTAQLLENSEIDFAKNTAAQSYSLNEAAPTNNTLGGIATFDPVLISMVRRAMPNLIAYDIAGVQPMTGPTGLIFAMHAKYVDHATPASRTEAFVNEPETTFSAASRDLATLGAPGTPAITEQDIDATGLSTGGTPSTPLDSTEADGTVAGDGGGFKLEDIMDTGEGEALGDASTNEFAEMAFTISKVTVEAKTRALKAEYTMELAQDLRAVHGLDAEAELSNILSTEALAEINREVVRTIYRQAKLSTQGTNPGIFNAAALSAGDADGRWQAERFKSIAVAIQFEANQIARETRRGKGNFVLCSSDVATALSAAGSLAYASASVEGSLSVDDTGNTFAGMMGSMKVYIDPYAHGNFACIGYRGANPYDAGVFYCPYVPLTKVRATGEQTFQPKIGFKTRYGMVVNPYVGAQAGTAAEGTRANQYFRIMRIDNL